MRFSFFQAFCCYTKNNSPVDLFSMLPEKYRVTEFFKKLLPTDQGQVNVKLGKWSVLNITATDEKQLQKIQEAVFEKTSRKLRVSPIKDDQDKIRYYQISIPNHLVENLCNKLELSYNTKEIEKELKMTGMEMQSDGLLIDYSKPTAQVNFEQFKNEYKKRYKSDFFKNPLLSGDEHLQKLKLHSIRDIEAYAHKHKSSRAAQVLNEIKFKP